MCQILRHQFSDWALDSRLSDERPFASCVNRAGKMLTKQELKKTVFIAAVMIGLDSIVSKIYCLLGLLFPSWTRISSKNRNGFDLGHQGGHLSQMTLVFVRHCKPSNATQYSLTRLSIRTRGGFWTHLYYFREMSYLDISTFSPTIVHCPCLYLQQKLCTVMFKRNITLRFTDVGITS